MVVEPAGSANGGNYAALIAASLDGLVSINFSTG